MKTSGLLFGIFILLIGIYLLVRPSATPASLPHAEIDFAVQDTAAIQAVILTKMESGASTEQLELERQADGSWLVNGEYPAFQARINTLLTTLYLIHVREVLAKKGQEAGKALLDRMHTRVDIFTKQGLLKSMLVGTEGKGGKGTLMMLKNAQNPYMVEIPGVPGYLNSRFRLSPELWRENLLFNANLAHIQAISLSYPDERQDFELYRTDPQQAWHIRETQQPVDRLAIKTYLKAFEGNIYAESFAGDRYPTKLQLLKPIPPSANIHIRYFSGEARTVVLHQRPNNRENYFGWVEGKVELLTIQAFVIEKFLQKKSFFLKE